MYMCTYGIGQYEFSNNHKVGMVLLVRGLCWVKVKGFLLAIILSPKSLLSK